MTQKIRLAFLGVGDVATRDYLPEFHRIADRAEIVAVCGRGAARSQAIAGQLGVAQWFTDYEQMLREAECDAVINLTPIQMHAETSLAALQAGKHVYSEKPIASTVVEANQLRDEARQRHLKFVCAPCVLIWPQVLHAQALLERGEIGEVHYARGRGYGGVPPWDGYASDPTPYFTQGGGPLRDMGVYPLHALVGLLGPVQRVSAMSARAQRGFTPSDGPAQGKAIPIEVPDVWQVTLDFGGERIASLESNNAVQATRAPELELMGLRGTLALNLIDVGAPIELLRAEGDGAWEKIELPRTGRARGPDHLLGIAHLLDCIELDRAPTLSAEVAAHVINIIEQAEASARSGIAVRVGH
jgi:predicted dehydrogenase